jgi:D-aspartate ligase
MMKSQTLACVMGDMDLVRPLGLARIPCAVVARPDAATRFSRFTRSIVEWADPWDHAEELVGRLLRFALAQPEPPVLYYEEDRELLLVSRYRERLAEGFRFVVAEPELVEDLVDKARFQALAERLELPVPATRHLCPASGGDPDDVDLRYPLIVKPITRRTDRWETVGTAGKAVRVEDSAALRELWPRLAASGLEFLAQEQVPGPETRIESYHVYVDARQEIVAEFTGRKIRTYPAEYGHSTALVITDEQDVADLGRALTRRLGLTGVAKFDFKRGPDGQLHLLEVNPRFNLWHHPGAIAGVNFPELVYADMTGRPRPMVRPARPGVCWGLLWHDLPAAKQWHEPLHRWVPWALACEAKSGLALDDPLPFLRGVLWRKLAGRLQPRGTAVQVRTAKGPA